MKMGRQLESVLYAVLAGICSSSAGIFSKIAMGVDEFFGIDNQIGYTYSARFVMVVMVMLANISVWLMYTKSLRFGSTLSSTGISIASNYIFTAFSGVILFAERCSFLWTCGTLSVMIGVMLMSI